MTRSFGKCSVTQAVGFSGQNTLQWTKMCTAEFIDFYCIIICIESTFIQSHTTKFPLQVEWKIHYSWGVSSYLWLFRNECIPCPWWSL